MLLLGPAKRTAGIPSWVFESTGLYRMTMAQPHPCSKYLTLRRAYTPGEFKLMTSKDGGNFEEAACWQKPSRPDVSIVETVMFDTPQKAQALTIAMRDPMPWKYFGINDVTLIVEPYAFMLVSGAKSSLGELCLVARGSGLGTEPCLKAVAAGDGREIFRFNDVGQIVDAGAKCMTLVDGDASMGGKLALETCATAADADDGRSSWALTSSSQLKLDKLGNYCLDVSAKEPSVHACEDDSINSADRFTLAAVPEFDMHASAALKSTASLLKAAAGRQSNLLAKLLEAMALLQACTLPTVATTSHAAALAALPALPILRKERVMATTRAADAAMAAIEQIYAAEDVDMTFVQQLIVETAEAIKKAG